LGLLVWHPSRQASRKSAGFAEASERRPRKGRPRVQKVAAVETYQGTPVGFTADGHPFRGNPDAALTLVEYTDYLCPFCERYDARDSEPNLAGQLRPTQTRSTRFSRGFRALISTLNDPRPLLSSSPPGAYALSARVFSMRRERESGQPRASVPPRITSFRDRRHADVAAAE
jgi:hypothetical protein